VSRAARAVCACLVIAATASASAETLDPHERAAFAQPLHAALERFDRRRAAIVASAGAELAYDLQRRLQGDLESLGDAVDASYGSAALRETVANVVRLDIDALDALAAGAPQPLVATPGLHEFVVRSHVDGTLQPIALYVPSEVRPNERVPLAIVLHGRPQTESELLGQPTLRRLADETHTILLAPYGRGNYDFAEPAATDVNDLAADARTALPVDSRRVYLAGYSMGGFSVYKIGTRAQARWGAVMSISGAVLNSDVSRVSFAWRDKPLYIVTGGHDESVPTAYGEQSASVLASLGVPVSFYEEPGGGHALRTLRPALERAWSDMHAGIVRTGSAPPAARRFVAPVQGSSPVKD